MNFRGTLPKRGFWLAKAEVWPGLARLSRDQNNCRAAWQSDTARAVNCEIQAKEEMMFLGERMDGAGLQVFNSNFFCSARAQCGTNGQGI